MPASEAVLTMSPPRPPFSRLMCSRATSVPSITAIYKKKRCCGSEFLCWYRYSTGSGLASKQIPILMRILPRFRHVGKSEFFFTFSVSIASLRSLIFLISVKYVTIFNILKFPGKKFSLSTFTSAWNCTDPDRPDPNRQGLDADPDPDPDLANLCGSDRIRIHNTEKRKNCFKGCFDSPSKAVFFMIHWWIFGLTQSFAVNDYVHANINILF